MVQCRVLIRDFSADPLIGDIPSNAVVAIARAQVSVTGDALVTEREQIVPIPGGDRTLQLDPSTFYRIRLPHTDGFRQKTWIRTTTTDLALATLYAEHQVDPGAFTPITDPPETIADLLAEALAILTDGAGGALAGSYPNPGFNQTVLDQAVAGRIKAPASQVAAALAATYATKAELSATGAGFQYLQSTAAASWSIPHAFGRRPNVELYTLAGERIFTDLTATTSAVYVTFPSPTAGYAVLT